MHLACHFALLVLAASPGETNRSNKDKHWAFRAPVRPPIPVARDAAKVRTPVDAFLLHRLEHAGLTFSPPAEKTVLLRRVTFDLTGLPPTPAETDAFFADSSPNAFEKVVDRLLASPAYGEHWGRYWLDLVRYADTDGYESDKERLHAWRYRDYVIRSFNDDKGYDRFILEQLAGDLLAKERHDLATQGSASRTAELLVAASFNRLGAVHQKTMNTPAAVVRQEELIEMAGAVGYSFLGLTVACARCHDHKFDPIPQSDYFKIQAFFAGTSYKDLEIASATEKAVASAAIAKHESEINALKTQLTALERPYREGIRAERIAHLLEPRFVDALKIPADKRDKDQKELARQAEILLEIEWDEVVDRLSPADRDRRTHLRDKMHDLVAHAPELVPTAWTVSEEDKPPPTRLLKRGDPLQPKEEVQPGFPGALVSTKTMLPTPEPRRNRLDLANWLTRPDHPLTARVIVNRLWQHHFGKGIVASGNDFGLRGEKPSHPELLDWLATELPSHGWSLKYLHRLMVLSTAYQQQSKPLPDMLRSRDPDNRLLARQNRQRLEGETLRDAALAVAGTLNRRQGGRYVRIPIEPEVYALIFTEHEPDGLWPVTPDPREHQRRSVYLYTMRNMRLPVLEAFDQPDRMASCPQRAVSTFAPQALILLNGPFFQEQSKALAASLLRAASAPRQQVEQALRRALARPALATEIDMGEEFLRTQSALLRQRLRSRLPVALPPDIPNSVDPAHAAALADFCLAVLNRNEFLYID